MSEQAAYGSDNEKDVEKQTVFRASKDVLMAKAGGLSDLLVSSTCRY